ncbi:MAG: hypothetical protein U0T83_01945 [Bacteriovoracaceae bacterium]
MEVLEDQIIFEFTGRVNILKKGTNQYLGRILLKDGELISCEYDKIPGLKAFYNLIIDEQKLDIHFIIEPEIVNAHDRNMKDKIDFPKFKEKLNLYLAEYNKSLKLKPPGNLKLSINPNFIQKGEEIFAKEFDILCVISDYSKVDDIYKSTSLVDLEITNALISLRKKNALLVLK